MGITQYLAIKAYFAAESSGGIGDIDNLFAVGWQVYSCLIENMCDS
jgi:hypothetical protein